MPWLFDSDDTHNNTIAFLQVEATLKAGGADAEFFAYPGVGHAFLNSTPLPFSSFDAREAKQGFPPYSEEQATIAWGRITEFFKKNILAAA